jgi:hypothetical protein
MPSVGGPCWQEAFGPPLPCRSTNDRATIHRSAAYASCWGVERSKRAVIGCSQGFRLFDGTHSIRAATASRCSELVCRQQQLPHTHTLPAANRGVAHRWTAARLLTRPPFTKIRKDAPPSHAPSRFDQSSLPLLRGRPMTTHMAAVLEVRPCGDDPAKAVWRHSRIRTRHLEASSPSFPHPICL